MEGDMMMNSKDFVQYEDFGAVGDGVSDDMAAICAAHDYANAHHLMVKSKPEAEYYIGGSDRTAIIETQTNWSMSRFIIDDRAVENNKKPCFLVRSSLQPMDLSIKELSKDQTYLQLNLDQDCYVVVTNSNEKKFIRFGLNQDNGSDTTDCFIVDKEGNITSPIDWDYKEITSAVAWPMDDEILTISGGIFTTIANQAEPVYNYYSRGIDITRSNTIIEGLTHYVVGEGPQGSPYRGFLSAMKCANITFQDCFSTGHKIYTTIGSANLPVMMGSYDLHANNIVNFTLRNCKMNHINDQTRWGVIATNFCKNILVEDCVLSRLDAHMGVSGFYTIRNSQLGCKGLNAIGRGMLTIEKTVLYANHLLYLRRDYGSTWEGNVKIKDCKWILNNKGQKASALMVAMNNGMHDFGYTCYMPNTIEIENLYIDDTSLPESHELYLFSDPCTDDDKNLPSYDERPFPYTLPKKVTCKAVTVASGKSINVCENKTRFKNLEYVN